MFIAIFSEEYSIGLMANDEVVLIKDAEDEDEATEKAEYYAKKNEIFYNCLDVIKIDNGRIID